MSDVFGKAVFLQPLSMGDAGFGRCFIWEAQFFESLRPAQDWRRGDAARVREPLKEGLEVSSRRTRDAEKRQEDNITTKSLILAQDER